MAELCDNCGHALPNSVPVGYCTNCGEPVEPKPTKASRERDRAKAYFSVQGVVLGYIVRGDGKDEERDNLVVMDNKSERLYLRPVVLDIDVLSRQSEDDIVPGDVVRFMTNREEQMWASWPWTPSTSGPYEPGDIF